MPSPLDDPGAPDAPRTLVELLARAARTCAGRGVTVLDGRGRARARRTWSEVEASALASAARLARRGVGPGARVLVSLGTSWEWIEGWLGSVLAGAQPLALAPREGLGVGRAHLERLEALCTRLDVRLALVAPSVIEAARAEGFARLAALLAAPEELASLAPAQGFAPHAPTPDALAFLQLTSGSTGTPRAVRVPHRALVHNSAAILAALEEGGALVPRTPPSGVSWMPLHHDMGLVGCFVASMQRANELVLLPPRLFLARPRQWLEEISRLRGVVAPAPNFGYQSALERVDSLADLELSGWSAALCGAEMVRAATTAAFAERFAAAGFDARAFRPCYGLAEATLAVSFDVRGEGVRTRAVPVTHRAEAGLSETVALGRAVRDTTIAIVAPDGRALREGEVGEVVVRGPGVFAGYENEPEASAACLRDGALWTGDLGFLAEGELFVVGRLKDVLIVRGVNLMPHELEWLAEAKVGGGGSLRAAAFSVPRGAEGEEAVLVSEVAEADGERLAALERELRVAVGRELGLVLADLVLVRRGRIPRTTSGKVQRGELRRQYLAGELERVEPALDGTRSESRR